MNPPTHRLLKLAAAGGIALAISQPVAAAHPALPALSAAPAAIAQQLDGGRVPLGIALPADPTPTTLRAAMIAAGSVAKAAGARGIKIIVGLGPSQAQLAGAPGPVLEIEPTRTRGALALRSLPSGHLELTIAGHGEALLGAARVLSSPWLASLSGDAAHVPNGLARQITSAPAPPVERIAPAHATGPGALSLTTHVAVPIDRVITGGQAILRLGINYNAPAGGRVTVALNGNMLGAFNAPAQGTTLRVATYRLSSNWTTAGNLLPGYYLQPGANQITVSATPRRGAGNASTGLPGRLTLSPGSGLDLTTSPRPATEQLALWPFPLYGARAWSRTTVAMSGKADTGTLAALIGAMAATERITGVPADPIVTYRAPTPAQRAGNLLVAGDPLQLAALVYPGHIADGMLGEMAIPYGGVALVAVGARALNVLGQGYEPGRLNGRAVLIDGLGAAHLLAAAPPVSGFGAPKRPWLAPAALLAAIALGWIVLQMIRAQRRLAAMPELNVEDSEPVR